MPKKSLPSHEQTTVLAFAGTAVCVAIGLLLIVSNL